MIYYAVIDTNVLVSALLKPESVPGLIVAEALTGSIIPLLHDDIIEEYQDVLNRRKFHFDKRDIRLMIDSLAMRSIFVDAGPVTDFIPDPKDVVFYAVTMEKRQSDDAYLVTGNTKHFPIRPFVVTPREMLGIISGNTEIGKGLT